MKSYSYIIIFHILFLAACGKEKKPNHITEPPLIKEKEIKKDSIETDTILEEYNTTVQAPKEDIRAKISKTDFEKLQGAELEMALVRPIYSKIFDVDEDASLVVPNLTEGQKTLYFLRKIDESITSGEFEYWIKNTPIQQIKEAQTSLELLSNKRIDAIFDNASETVTTPELNINGENKATKMKKLKEDFSDIYNMEHDNLYKNMERYIRNHPEEFVIFTD